MCHSGLTLIYTPEPTSALEKLTDLLLVTLLLGPIEHI